MSDPDRNRWFRRRWSDPPRLRVPHSMRVAEAADLLELTGHELLEQWRRERAACKGRLP